jgi:formylglycine-generating enzyme required for sulfatase activity
MKRLNWIMLIATLMLNSCAPAPTPPPPTPTRLPPKPTLVPVDLSAPMEVGSTFAYVDGATLVAVPSGPFRMGHGGSDDPEHSVILSAFWIYATEVTNLQYSLCVAQAQCSPPDPISNLGFTDFASQNLPVAGVTWRQAVDYCNYVHAGLPTEAQWEKAARGPDGNTYPWGEADPACDLLNFNNCVRSTSDVGKYPKGRSYYGAFDMEGNVFEWVSDWYDALYYRTAPDQDPPGPDSGRARVIRSSGYRSNAGPLPAYARSFASPGEQRRDLGFRCAVNDPTYFAPFCQMVSTVNASDLASLKVECPNISIDVQTTNCRFGGGAIVTFNDDNAHDPNASFGGVAGCTLISGTPGSYPIQFSCLAASRAVMSSNCTYSGVTNATCAAHYRLNAANGTCEWDASDTSGLECLPGYYYDPVKHCCTGLYGGGTNYPACPVGTVFTEDGSKHYVCLPGGQALNVPEQVKSVNPPVCPNVCTLNENTCNERGLVFCSTTCACLSVGAKCPTH